MEKWVLLCWLSGVGLAQAFEWVGEGFKWLAESKTNQAMRVVEPDAAWEALQERGETLALPEQLFEAGKAYANLYRRTSVQQQIDELAQRLERGQGDRLSLMVQMGNLQIRNRQFSTAARTFLTAAMEFPTVETPVERLAFCLLSLGDHEGGYQLYAKLVQREHPGPGVVMNYGAASYNTENPEQAKEQFLTYTELRAGDWKGPYNLGAAYFALGDFDAALEQFVKAHNLAPARPYGLMGQAWVKDILQDEKGYEALKGELGQRLGPEDAGQLLARPRLPIFLADTPIFPLVALNASLDQEIRRVWVKHLMAQVARASHPLSIERLLREALRHDAKSADVINGLIELYAKTYEPMLASVMAEYGYLFYPEQASWRQIIEQYRALGPGEVLTLEQADLPEVSRFKTEYAAAIEEANKGNYGQAELMVRRLHRSYRGMGFLKEDLATIYRKSKMWPLAMAMYQHLCVLSQNQPKFLVLYANCALEAGLTDVAARYFQIQMQLNPDNQQLVMVSEELEKHASGKVPQMSEGPVEVNDPGKYAPLFITLAQKLIQEGNWEEAKKLLMVTKDISPADERVDRLLEVVENR